MRDVIRWNQSLSLALKTHKKKYIKSFFTKAEFPKQFAKYDVKIEKQRELANLKYAIKVLLCQR